MNLSNLLSGNKAPVPIEKQFGDLGKMDRSSGTERRMLLDFWQQKFFAKYNEQYPVNNVHVKWVKEMQEIYSADHIKLAMEYYITNCEDLKYLDGYPSIRALYGFREQLFMEAKRGPLSKNKRGQSNVNTKQVVEGWDK